MRSSRESTGGLTPFTPRSLVTLTYFVWSVISLQCPGQEPEAVGTLDDMCNLLPYLPDAPCGNATEARL